MRAAFSDYKFASSVWENGKDERNVDVDSDCCERLSDNCDDWLFFS